MVLEEDVVPLPCSTTPKREMMDNTEPGRDWHGEATDHDHLESGTPHAQTRTHDFDGPPNHLGGGASLHQDSAERDAGAFAGSRVEELPNSHNCNGDAGAGDDRQPSRAGDVFAVGDRVTYWSATHKQWMGAIVTKQNFDPSGQITTYDLDVKRGAQASKLRRLQPVRPSSAVTPAGTPAVPGSATPPGSVFLPQGAVQATTMNPRAKKEAHVDGDALTPFEVGEKVEYWSDTYQQYMPAFVQRVRDDGVTYDLDVKRGAQRRKMRGVVSAPKAANDGPQQKTSQHPQNARQVHGSEGVNDGIESPVHQVVHAETIAPRSIHKAGSATSGIPSRVRASTVDNTQTNQKFVQAPTHTAPVPSGAFIRASSSTPATKQSKGLKSGMLCRLEGLRATPQHNGTTGTLEQYDAASCRWTIRLESGEVKSVKPDNLIPQAPVVTIRHAASPDKSKDASIALSATPSATPPPKGGAAPAMHAAPVKLAPPHQAHTAVRSASPNVIRVQGEWTPVEMPVPPAEKFEEIQIGTDAFDPVTPGSVQQQLISKLNVSPMVNVEEMQGFRGGLNEGVWIINDSQSPSRADAGGGGALGALDLVLKLVRCFRLAPTVLTEAENFMKICRMFPDIVVDPVVAFPLKIFTCIGPDGNGRYDLIVMQKAPGQRLADLIAHKWYGNQVPDLMIILEKLGAALNDFHSKYNNSQHGDFQPSNIFYDEDSDKVSFIDCGGMGVPTMENDIEHFSKSLRLLSGAYGPQLLSDGMRHFEGGYNRAKQRR